ncbi:MAG: hypothetical protein IOD12_07410 [Silvanigrellales bacterium]|nr:hypothetical protein [Silvanigrellales bacterium]
MKPQWARQTSFVKASSLTIAFLSLVAAPFKAVADEGDSRFSDVPPEFRSARTLGMGGTGVSFVRGLDALYVNPAGIAQSKSLVSEGVLVSPLVTAGEDGMKLYKDIDAGTDTFDMISKYSNRPQHVGLQNVTGIAFKRAAFGILQSGTVDVYAGTDPVTGVPAAEVRGIGRAAASFASARSFFDESLFFGVTTKMVQKRQLSLQLNAFEAQEQLKGKSSQALLNDNARQGTGLGADFGLLYRITEMDTKPTLGLVYRNVGLKYGWGVPKGKTAPDAEKPTLDVGFSLEPGTRRSFSRIAIDYVDATNAYKTSAFKKIHAGAELSFQNVIGVMAGVGQGYPSFGAYLNAKILRVEGGVYGEELGEEVGDLRSRRYFGRVSVGWLE